MSGSGRLVDYLGQGLAADRPSTLTLVSGAVGLWYSTDTEVLSAWDGSAWTDLSGSVTSVDMSVPSDFAIAGNPITSSGTLALTETTQAANKVKAGPTTGADAAPTYRALVSADIPDISATYATAAQGALAASALQSVVAGTNVTVDDTDPQNPVISATGGGGGSGTVTSVDMSVPAWLAVSGNPVTSAGTLAVSAAPGKTANQFLATPNGSAGAVGLRAIVAADVPTLNQSTTGSAATLTTPRAINGVNFDGSAAVTVPSMQLVGINDQTGTSYTLVLADAGKDVRCTNASAIALTVPLNSSVAFPIGTMIPFSQGGAGAVTATAASGVTINAANGSATTAQYDARVLEKVGTDTWRVW